MAVGETAKLIASLELKDKFSPTVAKVTKGLGTLDSRIDRSSSKATQFGQHLGIGIQNAAKITAVGVGILATNVALGLNSLVKLEKAQAQTAAVLKSTGQVAGITGEQITALAEKYEGLNAIVGDEVIRSAENLLLTFTKVRKDAFEPALSAILDMNTAMGKGPEGLQSTVVQVGKALNDPVKGITALRKAGVTFTDQQLDQIKALQKSGDLLGAQRIVLKELNKEFGGSFIAEGGTTGGKVAKFADAIEDLQRTLAAGFLPVVSKVADKLSALFQDRTVIKAVEDFGTSLAGLFSDANLKQGADVLGSLFRTAQEVAPTIASAAKITGEVVKTAVAAFTSLPKELQTLIVGGLAVNKLTGGIVTNIAGGLISSVLKQLVSGVVNVSGAVVNVNGGLPGGGGGPDNPLKPKNWLDDIVKLAAGATLLTGTSAALGFLSGANAATGTAKADAFGVKLPGDRPSKDLAVIIALTREQNGTLRDVDRSVLEAYRGTKTEIVKSIEAANATTTKVEGMRGLLGKKLDKVAVNTISAGVAAKNAGDKASTASRMAGITAGLAAKNAGTKTSAAARAAGVASAVAAKNAGSRSAAAADRAASAIRNKRLSTTVNVDVITRIDAREWLRQATVTNIRGGAS